MMEHNITTLETSKRLKAAGFPQNTLFSYSTTDSGTNQSIHLTLEPGDPNYKSPFYRVYAAPTAQELADSDWLPHSAGKDDSLEIWSWKTPTGRKWNAAYIDTRCRPHYLSTGPTLAEALAGTGLKLQETNPND
jgi:hypothetical protein